MRAKESSFSRMLINAEGMMKLKSQHLATIMVHQLNHQWRLKLVDQSVMRNRIFT